MLQLQVQQLQEPAREAQVKFLPRQRTASSGVARIRQSRELVGSGPRAKATPHRPRRHRRKKSGQSATPRFVRPAVETTAGAARCAVVVPLETTREALQAADVSAASSPRTEVPAKSTSPALGEEPDTPARMPSPSRSSSSDSFLRMLDRVTAEPASSTASPMTIDYSPCPLRTTQSLLALRRRLFDTSVLEPNVRAGTLMHTDHPEQQAATPAKAAAKAAASLPLTTPLIAAFNRWHRLCDTAHLADAGDDAVATPASDKEHPGLARAKRPSSGGVSPLACRMAWLRLQAQRDALDPTLCPFPPFGHDGRYLAAPQPHHSSSPHLSTSLLANRRRRLSGSVPTIHEDQDLVQDLFRVPSTPLHPGQDTQDAKRSRCSSTSLRRRMSFHGASSATSMAGSETLSLLNHGPVSSASSASLCSLFPGYRPPSIASIASMASMASSVTSSIGDLPALSSSPLADASLSSLRRQRCVRRRRRTSLADAGAIEEVLNREALALHPLTAAVSCPQIADDISPPGLSSSGYSSSTTATEPLGRRHTASSASSDETTSSHGPDLEPRAPATSTTTTSGR